MPLSTSSVDFRNRLEMRNLYTPDSVYDLNKDIVTQTLNAFQSAGFDLRTSLLLNVAERVVDNTPLVQVGAKRLALEMARKLAVNLIAENVGTINPDAILSKDPTKNLLIKHVDASITPKDKTSTNILDMIQVGLTGGTNSKIDVVGDNRETQLGGYQLFQYLGDTQKTYLQYNLNQNYYNRYPQKNVDRTGAFNLTTNFYDFDWVAANRADSLYSSYIMDRNGNKSLETQDRVIETLPQMLDLHAERQAMVEAEGFGTTVLPRTGENESDLDRFLQYTNYAATSQTVVDRRNKFNVQRGLLYYTQEMASSQSEAGVSTQIANHINTENTAYGPEDGVNIVWKGSSECRSFTMANQYGRFGEKILGTGNLMRFAGNNNPNSVLEKSVMPRIYPAKASDNRKVMFSLENLAYDEQDVAKLPVNERGPNKGRIMWFPPYGLTVSESARAKYDKTDFVGRIEPVYSYSGAERTASMSFVLLIDTPPDVQDYSHATLGAFFAHCAQIEEANNPAPTQIAVPTPRPTPTITGTESYGGDKPVYYYDNDSDVYLAGYELSGSETNEIPIGDPKNAYSLNKNFESSMDRLIQWVKDKYTDETNYCNFTIKITASSSALFTNDYNAQLSFRRSHELMNRFITEFNQKTGLNIALSNPLPIQKSDYATRVKKSDINSSGYVFPTSDRRIKFQITAEGEEYIKNPSKSDQETQINNRSAKIVRKASFVSIIAKPATPLDASKANSKTLAEKKDALEAARNPKTKPAIDAQERNTSGFKKETTTGTSAASGWNKLDYYKPVFHSQTPYDFYKRYTFLHQVTRPGSTVPKANNVGANSLFGKMPVCVLRIGDFFHTKVIIQNINFDMSETTWDQNPEGMGMQPMYCKVTIDFDIIGGMSLEKPIDRLLTAVDSGFTANSSFVKGKYYPKSRHDYNSDGNK